MSDTVLIDMVSREPDIFYQAQPNLHSKSVEYASVADKIETLWARYIGTCEFTPQYKLDEMIDEINRLEKEKEYLFKRDQMAISTMRKEMVTA
ncbi:MAG: hypothetical protein KGM99_18665 [Burkholderiales bacterium]|nr:hypothetical protein [Burkholderiales bacterium]